MCGRQALRAVKPFYIPGGVLPKFVGAGFCGGDVKKWGLKTDNSKLFTNFAC
jgi:hypothetical protein